MPRGEQHARVPVLAVRERPLDERAPTGFPARAGRQPLVPGLAAEPWRVGEVLLHAEPGRQAWDEWLPPGADWEARRRALVERPLPDREDWYSRVLLAARHRPPP